VHELKALYYIAYGIYLVIKFIVLSIYRGVRWIVLRLSDQGATPERSARPAPKPMMPTAASPPPKAIGLASVKLSRTLLAIQADAEREAERCAAEEQNERFADTLNRYVARRARAAVERLKVETPQAVREAEQLVAELTFVMAVTTEMAGQRRDADRLMLLGDADALAEACYRPLFEFARGSGVRLRSSRAATLLGDKDLAIFTGFIPAGLAPIILPAAWSTEVRWWPALAHEIGHDFHASVIGFDTELRRRAGLPDSIALPRPNVRLTKNDLDAAYAAWLAEIFADAFGTLMLGAAFVTTMIWAFADAKDPSSVVVVTPLAQGPRVPPVYEEHPPAHLRIVLACRLLSAIGFPREAEQLEADWRRRHNGPESLYVPNRAGGWYQVPETPYVAYGEALVEALYLAPSASLGGVSLRSIPGLDLGPREHQAALDARDAFLAGQEADTRDPRCLIAGAVLAATDRPALAARVLVAARATIPSVGVSARQLRLRRARDASGGTSAELGASLFQEAFLLGEALAPPRGSKLRRRL
jgi:hypothetical protein